MRTATLHRLRDESGPFGTFSQFVIGTLELYLGELPWRDNHHDLSCLPPAREVDDVIVYLLKYTWSEAHKRKNYRFVNMKQPDGSWGPMPGGREAAEIHAANLMGDIFQQFAAQVEGCGAPGRAIVTFRKGATFKSFTEASPSKLVPMTLAKDQLGMASSQDALNAFEAEMAGEDLELTVSWV